MEKHPSWLVYSPSSKSTTTNFFPEKDKKYGDYRSVFWKKNKHEPDRVELKMEDLAQLSSVNVALKIALEIGRLGHEKTRISQKKDIRV